MTDHIDEEYITESEGESDLSKLESKCHKATPAYRKSEAKRKPGRPRKYNKSNNVLLKADFLRPFPEELKNKDCASSEKVGATFDSSDDVRKLMEDVSADLKQDLGSLSSKLNRLFSVMTVLVERVDDLEKRDRGHVEHLRLHDKRICELESRLEESERRATLNKALLTYDNINSNSDSLKTDVSKFLTDKMKLSPAVMSGLVVSRFGKGDHTVLLEFSSVDCKREIFRSKKKLYNDENANYSTLFVNDFLTKNRSVILKKARDLKKERRIHSAFSFDGNVYIKVHDGDEKMIVRDISVLLEF